jgi:hypothetical protein
VGNILCPDHRVTPLGTDIVAELCSSATHLMAALIEETALPRHELVVWGK